MTDDLQKEFDALLGQMTPLQQAEMVLPIWEAEYLDDKAPRLAVEGVEGVCLYAPSEKLLHAFALTTDDLKRKVIATGKAILKRDKEGK